MRAASPKRARQLRERRKLVERVEPQACERCHREPAVDVHELTRRSQSSSSATDLDEMVPIGRTCHDWIGQNPLLAVVTGWAKWRAKPFPEVEILWLLARRVAAGPDLPVRAGVEGARLFAQVVANVRDGSAFADGA